MEKGNIVTVVTQSGEYVGKLVSVDAVTELENPRMIIRNPENGEMGFAKGIAATGEENPTSVVFQNIVFCVPSNKRVVDAFLIATGEKDAPKIEVPAEKKIIT